MGVVGAIGRVGEVTTVGTGMGGRNVWREVSFTQMMYGDWERRAAKKRAVSAGSGSMVGTDERLLLLTRASVIESRRVIGAADKRNLVVEMRLNGNEWEWEWGENGWEGIELQEAG